MAFFEDRTAIGRELDRREAQRQNGARYARTTLTVESSGTGRVRHNDILAFPQPFIDEPVMTQGSGVVHNPDPAHYWDPEGSAGVWAWAMNEKGFYTGCKIWTSVVYQAVQDYSDGPSDGVKVQHWLVFEGTAIKDLGQEATDAAINLSPRQVHF